MSSRPLTLALLCLPAWVGAQMTPAVVAGGQAFTLDADTRVFFGDRATDRLLIATLGKGSHLCVKGSGNFYADPAPDAAASAKTCFLPGAGYVIEGDQFTLPAGGTVWYGNGSRYVTYDAPAGNGKFTCSNAQAKRDPAPGIVKFCRASAYRETLGCYPSQLGGTGSRAAWGVSLSPVQAWAGWWCNTSQLQIVACAASGCLPDVARRVISTTSDTLNVELRGARTEHIDSPALRAVWEPHAAEIDAVKP